MWYSKILPNNKCCGKDGINNELLKYGGESVSDTSIINKIF